MEEDSKAANIARLLGSPFCSQLFRFQQTKELESLPSGLMIFINHKFTL